jgi:hypothetical protein
MNRKLKLSQHDETLANAARNAIDEAISKAENPIAVAKRIVVRAVQHRNKGRKSIEKKYPFNGICEISGLPLKKEIASLDEIESEKGFILGNVRWICQKANNDGSGTCGDC